MSSPILSLFLNNLEFNNKKQCEQDQSILINRKDEEQTEDEKDTEKTSGNGKEQKNVKKRIIPVIVLSLVIFVMCLLLLVIFERNSICGGLEEEVQTPKPKECSADVFYHDLAETDDSITYFMPPRNICFTISRSGIYYLGLSIKLSCTITKLEQVSVTLRNESPQNPTSSFIINKRTCNVDHMYISEQKTFRAHKFDEVCFESFSCLGRYSGNFIILNWFKED